MEGTNNKIKHIAIAKFEPTPEKDSGFPSGSGKAGSGADG
jgi:hypothetical protein